MFSTRSGCFTLPIKRLVGNDEELLARIASASATSSSWANASRFEVEPLRDRFDHHPGTPHGLRQVVKEDTWPLRDPARFERV